jgi:hypothetical protein
MFGCSDIVNTFIEDGLAKGVLQDIVPRDQVIDHGRCCQEGVKHARVPLLSVMEDELLLFKNRVQNLQGFNLSGRIKNLIHRRSESMDTRVTLVRLYQNFHAERKREILEKEIPNPDGVRSWFNFDYTRMN